jgi:CubicO group peptidase (beta-lactamase class C family)
MAKVLSTLRACEDPQALGFRPEMLARFRPWLASYVDSGRLPGGLLIIARRGQVALVECLGHKDAEVAAPLEADALFRIYSMTKPVTAVAVLQLMEAGAFTLETPLSEFLPDFAEMAVLQAEDGPVERSRPSRRAVTVGDLLTHRAGLTYGLLNDSPLAKYYRENKLDFGPRDGRNAEIVSRLADTPLLCEPAGLWRYGVAFDVLGHLVELVSGRDLATYLRQEVFAPLAMKDTAFSVPDGKIDRFASLYRATAGDGMALVEDAEGSLYRGDVETLSGGGGLISTAGDYLRFAEMLRLGGRLGQERLLSAESVALMSRNHLPCELSEIGDTSFSEMTFEGFGFGLGVSVMLDPARAGIPGSPGEFAWGGAASTAFFVDPQEDMTVVFMTQLLPSNRYPLRRELRTLVYQALDR